MSGCDFSDDDSASCATALRRAGAVPIVVVQIKAFCDLTASARIAKTRRNKELEQKSVYA
jgi:hypothetical protein